MLHRSRLTLKPLHQMPPFSLLPQAPAVPLLSVTRLQWASPTPTRHETFNVQILQGQASTCCQGLATCGFGAQSRSAALGPNQSWSSWTAVGSGSSPGASLTLAHEADHCPPRNNGVSCAVPSGKCFLFFSPHAGKRCCLLVPRCKPLYWCSENITLLWLHCFIGFLHEL